MAEKFEISEEKDIILGVRNPLKELAEEVGARTPSMLGGTSPSSIFGKLWLFTPFCLLNVLICIDYYRSFCMKNEDYLINFLRYFFHNVSRLASGL